MTEQARADEPRYLLLVEYTFDDYKEAVRCDASVVAGGFRWRGLLAWAILFALVIFPQLWLRPVRTGPGAAPLPLARALVNLIASLLPLLIWLLVFTFILTSVYLNVRGRKRRQRPIYQIVQPGADATFGGRLGWVILVALVLVAQTLVSAASLPGGADRAGRSFGVEAAVRLLPTMLFLSMGAVVFWYGMRARIRRAWQGQPSMHLHHTFEFFEDRVIVDTTQSRTESRWTAYPRLLETPNLLLLYVSDLAFHILPKRALAGDDEFERFRAFLLKRIATPTQAFPVVPSPTSV